jgi:hypothetical protein
MTPNLKTFNVRELMGQSPGGDNSALKLVQNKTTPKGVGALQQKWY